MSKSEKASNKANKNSVSVIVCSRNRAPQLQDFLDKLPAATFADRQIELILVNSASTDNTLSLMQGFAGQAPFPVKIVNVEKKGLGRARNRGIEKATGEICVFTDDDCYFADDYFEALEEHFTREKCQYAGGRIRLFDPNNAPIGRTYIKHEKIIPPDSFIRTGDIQGSNIIVARSVFQNGHMFREDMGAGTPFPCEDIEFTARLSRRGYTGAFLPQVIVDHNHRRKLNSPAHLETFKGYDIGRGAYYMAMAADGFFKFLPWWGKETLHRIKTKGLSSGLKSFAYEIHGAGHYLFSRLTQKIKECCTFNNN